MYCTFERHLSGRLCTFGGYSAQFRPTLVQRRYSNSIKWTYQVMAVLIYTYITKHNATMTVYDTINGAVYIISTDQCPPYPDRILSPVLLEPVQTSALRGNGICTQDIPLTDE